MNAMPFMSRLTSIALAAIACCGGKYLLAAELSSHDQRESETSTQALAINAEELLVISNNHTNAAWEDCLGEPNQTQCQDCCDGACGADNECLQQCYAACLNDLP